MDAVVQKACHQRIDLLLLPAAQRIVAEAYRDPGSVDGHELIAGIPRIRPRPVAGEVPVGIVGQRGTAKGEDAIGVIVRDGKIVGEGFHQRYGGAHAEIVAIREACRKLESFQLDECELYTTCEPCPMCLGAIYWARPARVYYASTASDAAAAGFDDAFIYEELQTPLEERRIPMMELQRAEALVIFQEWLAKSDKKPY